MDITICDEVPEACVETLGYNHLVEELKGVVRNEAVTSAVVMAALNRHRNVRHSIIHSRSHVGVAKVDLQIKKLEKLLALQQDKERHEQVERGKASAPVPLELTPIAPQAPAHPAAMRIASSHKRGNGLLQAALQMSTSSAPRPGLPGGTPSRGSEMCSLCRATTNLRPCTERASQAAAMVCSRCLDENRDSLTVVTPASRRDPKPGTPPSRAHFPPISPAAFMGSSHRLSPRLRLEPRAPRLLSRKHHKRKAREKEDSVGPSHGTEDNPILLNSSEDEAVQPPVPTASPEAVDLSHNTGSGAAEPSSGIAESLAGLHCIYPPAGGPGSVQVTAKDLARLEAGAFLNDTVIDFYLRHIQSELSPSALERCHFYSTFFYSKLREKSGGEIPVGAQVRESASPSECQAIRNYHKVKKWTKDVDIFAKDYLFIPICHALHWSLMIVCHPGISQLASRGAGPTPCILHLDSMQNGHQSADSARRIRSYLELECALRGRKEQDPGARGRRVFDGVTFPHKRIKVARQDNFCDCGLFLCTYAEFFATHLPPCINAKEAYEMSYEYRKTNRDLFEGTQDCYPGRLTEFWFRRGNAAALRHHIQKTLLRLIAVQNSLCKVVEGDSRTPEVMIWQEADPRARSIHAVLDVINALEKLERYIGPAEWLEQARLDKSARQEKLADIVPASPAVGTRQRKLPSQPPGQLEIVLQSASPSSSGSEEDGPAELGRPATQLPPASDTPPSLPALSLSPEAWRVVVPPPPQASTSTTSESSDEDESLGGAAANHATPAGTLSPGLRMELPGAVQRHPRPEEPHISSPVGLQGLPRMVTPLLEQVYRRKRQQNVEHGRQEGLSFTERVKNDCSQYL